MAFVRGTWRILVGVKDALVLIFMLLFFAALAAALSSRPGGKAIRDGALVLDLKGAIVEQPAEISAQEALSGGAMKQHRARDLIAALDAAKDDVRVKVVVLQLDGFTGGGQVTLTEVGEAIARVRAKKPVLAYAGAYGDDSYQLAANASEIWLDPLGGAIFAGPGGSRLYYKGLVERLGATVHVYRVGTYKSAVEPFILDRQSEPARQANQALVDGLWSEWQTEVGKARPKAKLAAYVTDPVAATVTGDFAQSAVDAGLVDKLADPIAFAKRVRELAGEGRDNADYARIDMKTYIAARVKAKSGAQVGIVTVAGVIEDGEQPAGTAGGDTIAAIIRKAVKDDEVKALVLRVDSPGGSVIASERIRVALLEAKAKGLPIVVSMGNLAASGGYWISTPADRIFAEPTTITGSIGVFGVFPTFENSLKKIGVNPDGVTTTPLSGQPDIYAGTNAATDTLLQRSVENIYGRFTGLVAASRKLPIERVREIAEGRVWIGGTARQLGLVDQFGGIDDAVAEAAKRAKLSGDAALPRYLEQEGGWEAALAEALSGGGDATAAAPRDVFGLLARDNLAQLASAVADADRLLATPSAQVRCLDCPAPVVTPPAARSLVDVMLAWWRA